MSVARSYSNIEMLAIAKEPNEKVEKNVNTFNFVFLLTVNSLRYLIYKFRLDLKCNGFTLSSLRALTAI